MRRSKLVALLVAVGVAVLPPVLGPVPAHAATCSAPFRYAPTSNSIYVTGATTPVTLTSIREGCSSAPLELVDPASKTWQLNADIQLEAGSTLNLHGGPGGDVGTLRLRSGSAGTLDVVSITAQYGTVSIKDTTITSWDPATNAVDTDANIPAGGVRGRAFIRALSILEGNTPRTSTMDIVNSDLGYLGFFGPESYGVAYKARGCGVDTPAVCDALGVLGKQIGSKFHHNFMGTYTWGADGMEFSGNEYFANISYGLDPHDNSDYLLIKNNKMYDNGNHGLICSVACDHLTITDNEVTNNGQTPYVAPGDPDPGDNQVHGIMLHRGITDSVVKNNTVRGHTTGAGIAVFDSVGNTVEGNTVTGNRFGLRFSVGTRGTVVSGNSVTDSSSHALFAFKGNNPAIYTGTSGRPADIVFTGNTFTGSGAELFKVQDADRFTFKGGQIGGTMALGPLFERAQGHVYEASVSTPAGTNFTLRGTVAVTTDATFAGMRADEIAVTKYAHSTATFTG